MNISPPSSGSKNKQSETLVALLAAVTFNGLHGVISQKAVLFITTAVRTSNPVCVTTGSIYFVYTKGSHNEQSNQPKVP
jgi:hypothetical protein